MNIKIDKFTLPIIKIDGDVEAAYAKQQTEEWEIICTVGNLEIKDHIVEKIKRASFEEKFEKFRITSFRDNKNKPLHWFEGKRSELLFLKHSVAVYKEIKSCQEIYKKFKSRLDKLEKNPVQMNLFEGF